MSGASYLIGKFFRVCSVMLYTLFVMGEIGLYEDRNLSRPLLLFL